MMPGTVCRTTHGSRADGMFCSSSFVIVVETLSRFGSTTGDSTETCTCSETPATLSVMRSGTDPPVATATDLLRYSAKPDSDAFT